MGSFTGPRYTDRKIPSKIFMIIKTICIFLAFLLPFTITIEPSKPLIYGFGEVILTSTCNIWATTWQNQQNECAQRRLRSAWASAQSDQSLRCPHEETLGPQLHIQRMLRLIWVFTGCTLALLVLSCRGSNYHQNDIHLICFSVGMILTVEQPLDKTNKMIAPSDDSDQPGHQPSLISLRSALNG